MRAVIVHGSGESTNLVVEEVPSPRPGPGELLISVRATAVNRADLHQRKGQYPAPPGASTILGLECAGEVAEVGAMVVGFAPGDRVMALLAGGGYASEVVVDAGSVMRVPDPWSWDEAAAFPEVFLTAYLNLFMNGSTRSGTHVLVHGGGSGVGTASILLCNEAGAPIAITAGSDDKCARCLDLGADLAINYRTEDFQSATSGWTEGRGVDVILDSIGGSYLEKNIFSLATDGRLVVIGGMGGREGRLDLGRLLMRRLRVIGSTLRSRTSAEKKEIVQRFLSEFGDAISRGSIRAVVDRVLPLADAEEAHRVVAASEHFGKVVLRID